MKISINEEFCKGCWLCITFCPKRVLQKSNKISKKGFFVPKVVNEKNCTGCRNCELYCPEFAVSVEKR